MRVQRDDGSVVPLLGVVLLVGVLAMLAVGAVANRLVSEARAQTAADAAALAGVRGGPAAASAVAGANGAVLVSFDLVDDAGVGQDAAPWSGVVVATVRVSGVTAVAAAAPS